MVQVKYIKGLSALVRRDQILTLGIANCKKIPRAAGKEMNAWRDQVQSNTQGMEFLASKQKLLGM